MFDNIDTSIESRQQFKRPPLSPKHISLKKYASHGNGVAGYTNNVQHIVLHSLYPPSDELMIFNKEIKKKTVGNYRDCSSPVTRDNSICITWYSSPPLIRPPRQRPPAYTAAFAVH